MNAFVQTNPRVAARPAVAGLARRAIKAARRWEARRLAAARVQDMSVGQLRTIGLRTPQALAVRYGMPIPAAEE